MLLTKLLQVFTEKLQVMKKEARIRRKGQVTVRMDRRGEGSKRKDSKREAVKGRAGKGMERHI